MLDLVHLWQGPLEHLVGALEQGYLPWVSGTLTWYLFIPLAFVGGVIASISPCILALLPMNLGYIGVSTIQSRQQAFFKAISFVLGTVLVLSLLGLVGSFAALLMVQLRGYVQIAVGLFSLLAVAVFTGRIQLPQLPGLRRMPSHVAPFVVGVVFALVSSPCASPILFTMLAAASSTGIPLLGVLTMVAYSLGYTAVIFLASVLTGFSKHLVQVRHQSRWVEGAGALVLLVVGLSYLVSGVRWFM